MAFARWGDGGVGGDKGDGGLGRGRDTGWGWGLGSGVGVGGWGWERRDGGGVCVFFSLFYVHVLSGSSLATCNDHTLPRHGKGGNAPTSRHAAMFG